MTNVKTLSWDSKTFGYRVGELNLMGMQNVSDLSSLINSDCKLIYVYSQPNSPVGKALDGLNAVNAGTKKKYVLSTSKASKLTDGELSQNITDFVSCTAVNGNDSLRELALESGVYSRFARDRNFIGGEYIRLYENWIQKSIAKSMEVPIYVCIIKSQIVGFISLSQINLDTLAIELLAVRKDKRGEGIASSLLRRVIQYAQGMNILQIQVSTQGDNLPAQKLYSKIGFELREEIQVHHYWRNEKNYIQ